MKNHWWKLLILIFLVLIAVFWFVRIPFISNYLTKKTRVPVSIEWIGIWPRETTLRGFKIKNPEGYKMKVAFKAESTEINYQLKNLISNPTKFDQIFLKDVFLGVEFLDPYQPTNNWTQIGKNMKASKSQKRVIIDKLVLTNLKIEILGLELSGKPLTKTVDRLEFENIDSAKGFPTEELVQKVFGGAGIGEYIEDVFNPENLLNPFHIFGHQSE